MINGPYEEMAQRNYLKAQQGINSMPPGYYDGKSAVVDARPEKIKEAEMKKAMAAQRDYELSSLTREIDLCRLRLLALDLSVEADALNQAVIQLVQRWLIERQR